MQGPISAGVLVFNLAGGPQPILVFAVKDNLGSPDQVKGEVRDS
jgi:hypothetical protein